MSAEQVALIPECAECERPWLPADDDEPCYFAGRCPLRARVGQTKRIGPFHARARGVRAPPDAGRAGCRSYKLTWRLKDKFFGVGR